MKWLLDTNVVSEPIRSRPHAKVVGWLTAIAREDAVVSVVTLAELRDGAATAVEEQRRTILAAWLDNQIAPSFHDRTLPVTDDILIDWIGLSRRLRRAGKPRDPADLLLAATARAHHLIVATRNIQDFADTGIVVYDPLTDETHRMDRP